MVKSRHSRHDCVNPYDHSKNTSARRKFKSCQKNENGQFPNIQTCIENCTVEKHRERETLAERQRREEARAKKKAVTERQRREQEAQRREVEVMARRRAAEEVMARRRARKMENKYSCNQILGCISHEDGEYATIGECLNNCNFLDILTEVLQRLSYIDKIKYFNSNPNVVNGIIEKYQYSKTALKPNGSPGILHPILIYGQPSNLGFRVIPEMIAEIKLSNHNIEEYIKYHDRLINLIKLIIDHRIDNLKYAIPVTLPQGLQTLEIGGSKSNCNFNQPILLPKGLQSLKIQDGSEFNRPLDLPQGLRHLTISGDFNKPTPGQNSLYLPQGLQSFEIGEKSKFNKPITLPDGLQSLKIEDFSEFNQPIILPQGLRNLVVGFRSSFNQTTPGKNYLELPQGLQSLRLSGEFDKQIRLPNGDVDNKPYRKVKEWLRSKG